MKKMTYAASGVDIDKGDRFARFIAGLKSPAVSSGIGGFSGGIEFDASRYLHPVLLSTTDGVGTKLLVAQKLGRFDTIGIDLVAMNVNDLAVCGARPMAFLDYIACGSIDEELLHALIAGIVKGCELAGCTLVGGETAEMPDLYRDGDFDLAGFCTGLVDRDKLLPRLDRMKAGDPVYALPSSGIHSNGLSLARKALPESEGWDELLVPTRIYVKELHSIFEGGTVLAAAHITGGGLLGNLSRVIQKGLHPVIRWDWPVPPVFKRIQEQGRIETEEMRRVFNLGVGICLVVDSERENDFLSDCARLGITVFPIGDLTRG
jgi:phosphoribosylformylglycinamidine cyclo-ligase